MSSPMLIRPKSIATVVVVLCSMPSSTSRPRPGSLSTSSVCSGRISVTAPTMVVLPTPKPPAIKILITIGVPAVSSAPSDSAKPIGDPPEQLRVRQLSWRHGRANDDEAAFPQISEGDPDHPDRQAEGGAGRRHRGRRVALGQGAPLVWLQRLD